LKRRLQSLPGVTFRTLHDAEGECCTLLTVFLPARDAAAKVAARLGTTTVSQSGWHVYSNMEQILGKKMITPEGCPFNCASHPCTVEYRKGMLPRTDGLLERAINLSVGVVDRGLGAAFGVNPRSTDEDVDRVAAQVADAVRASV
jgi:8-amino-3,8-dideoxy-alpha-D-manno-octulosonate transaminase